MNETTPTIDPRHTILLVMDYQPVILSNLPDATELLPRTAKMINTLRGVGAFSIADLLERVQ